MLKLGSAHAVSNEFALPPRAELATHWDPEDWSHLRGLAGCQGRNSQLFRWASGPRKAMKAVGTIFDPGLSLLLDRRSLQPIELLVDSDATILRPVRNM